MRPLITLGIFYTAFCQAEAIVCVLYSEASGLSASAAASVVVASGEKNFEFDTSVRVLAELSSTCREIGAVWTVEFEPERDSSLNLMSVKCDGVVDSSVHRAWLVVREHLRMRSQNQVIDASEPLSERFRRTDAFSDYRSAVVMVDFSAYQDFGRDGRCLAVTNATQELVEVTTTADCLVSFRSGSPVNIEFKVIRGATDGQAIVDDIKLSVVTPSLIR